MDLKEELTEEEIKKKAYLLALRLKNSGSDAETIYARLEKDGEAIATTMTLSKKVILPLIIMISMTSCTNYYLTAESLRDQFKGIDSTSLEPVIVRGPIGEKYTYQANPIVIIQCVDKQGNPAQLTNKPSIEMRVTEKNGKRTIFYFDRVHVTDSTLYGVQSRFISSIRKSIKLNDIKKIEIQDGKKNFVYVSK